MLTIERDAKRRVTLASFKSAPTTTNSFVVKRSQKSAIATYDRNGIVLMRCGWQLGRPSGRFTAVTGDPSLELVVTLPKTFRWKEKKNPFTCSIKGISDGKPFEGTFDPVSKQKNFKT